MKNSLLLALATDSGVPSFRGDSRVGWSICLGSYRPG